MITILSPLFLFLRSPGLPCPSQSQGSVMCFKQLLWLSRGECIRDESASVGQETLLLELTSSWKSAPGSTGGDGPRQEGSPMSTGKREEGLWEPQGIGQQSRRGFRSSGGRHCPFFSSPNMLGSCSLPQSKAGLEILQDNSPVYPIGVVLDLLEKNSSS